MEELEEKPDTVIRYLSLISCCLLKPFLSIKNKRLLISCEGFSTFERSVVICSQRVILPIQSADSNGSLAHFF